MKLVILIACLNSHVHWEGRLTKLDRKLYREKWWRGKKAGNLYICPMHKCGSVTSDLNPLSYSSENTRQLVSIGSRITHCVCHFLNWATDSHKNVISEVNYDVICTISRAFNLSDTVYTLREIFFDFTNVRLHKKGK